MGETGVRSVLARLRAAPPVIVIGMHRSGTSLVAAMLFQLGVYGGADIDIRRIRSEVAARSAALVSGYAESGVFFRLNEEMLARAGARWDDPQPFLERRDHPRVAPREVAALEQRAARELAVGFQSGFESGRQSVWGWKDPRNSLTLPYWLNLFPGARVLHVRRDLESSAQSVYRRALQWEQSPSVETVPGCRPRIQGMNSERIVGALLRRLGKDGRPSNPCLDLDYCRRLCLCYVDEACRHRALGSSYREVWYDDVLREPESAARELCSFIGLESGTHTHRLAAGYVLSRTDTLTAASRS